MPPLALGPSGQTLVDPRLEALSARALRPENPLSGFSALSRLALLGSTAYAGKRKEREALEERGKFAARLAALSAPNPVTGAPPDAGAARMAALDLASEGMASADPSTRQAALSILQRSFDELLEPPSVSTEKFGHQGTGVRTIRTDKQTGKVTIETLQEPQPEPGAGKRAEMMTGAQLADLLGNPALGQGELASRPVEVEKDVDGNITGFQWGSLPTRVSNRTTVQNLTGVAGEIQSVRSAMDRGLIDQETGQRIINAMQGQAADPAGAAGDKKTAEQMALTTRQGERTRGAVSALQDFIQSAGPAARWSPAHQRLYATLQDAAANELAKLRGTPGAEPSGPGIEKARASLPTLDDLSMGSVGGAVAAAQGQDIVGPKFDALSAEIDRLTGGAPGRAPGRRRATDQAPKSEAEMSDDELDAEIRRLEAQQKRSRRRVRS